MALVSQVQVQMCVRAEGYLVNATRGHGAVVEAEERLHGFLATSPVALTPQVQAVVAPDDRVGQTGRQTRVQVRLVLAQARLSGQKPGRRQTWDQRHM